MKDYKLFKTAKKTARENGLVFADNQRIFDFSALDELNIPEEEKRAMKDAALQNVTAGNKTAFTIKQFSNFHFIDGYVDYSVYKVLADNGCKRIYCIFEASYIHHTSGTRKCVWDEYECKTIDNKGCALSRDIDFETYCLQEKEKTNNE